MKSRVDCGSKEVRGDCFWNIFGLFEQLSVSCCNCSFRACYLCWTGTECTIPEPSLSSTTSWRIEPFNHLTKSRVDWGSIERERGREMVTFVDCGLFEELFGFLLTAALEHVIHVVRRFQCDQCCFFGDGSCWISLRWSCLSVSALVGL